MKYPIIAVAILITSCSVIAQTAAPKLKIALYAANKNGSPLRIISFRYSDAAIGVLVRNDSDKTVSGFRIGGAVTIPAGCSESEEKLARLGVQTGSGLKTVRIEPHQTAATSASDPPLDPPGLVRAARTLKAARINVAVLIGEVTFADGSIWDHRQDAFSEAELANRDVGTCTNEDISTVIASVAKITTVGFKDESTLLVSREGSQADAPRLTFICLLNGDLATCAEAH